MSEEESSYRQIMKATSIFGGVQVFNIIINIIRSKFIAILLGPTGMGISGLLTATTGMITALTNFGLDTSAVKDVSAAYTNGNPDRVAIVVSVFHKLVWLTGIFGAVVTLTFSKWFSQLTFGNEDYTWAFVWLSITLLINQVSTGQSVMLRGTRQIKSIAKSAILGSILGLVTTVPMYYFYGLKGIVPGIIITSLTTLLLNWYFARKIEINSIQLSTNQVINESKGMLKMGFLISLSSLITLGASYIVRLYISNTGGVDQVGLYNAGFAIINTYVGLVFTAMGTDYYPRLSTVAHSNTKCRTVINQQAEIALLILAPIIVLFLVFINWVVIVLYSTKFVPVNDMILYAAIGMFFKAASWSVAFLFLAKGASKLFFWNELGANIYLLTFNLIGYKFGGLSGLGMSFLLAYFVYFIQVFIVSKKAYKFSFSQEFVKIFVIQFTVALVCLIVVKVLPSSFSYIIGSSLIMLSFYYTYKELDKRLDLKKLFSSIRNRL